MSQYNSMVVRKRQREQEKQKRRLQIKSASRDHRPGNSSSAGEIPAPLFGPIQKKDGGNELQKIAKNVLGDYQTAIRSMEGNDQRKFLGTVDTTPSTPVVPDRQNPFESSFRTGATGTSSAATSSRSSSSRHQVAEPPTSTSSGGSSKKEKSHPHSKHTKAPKSAAPSKPHPGSSAGSHEPSRSSKKHSGSSSGASGGGDGAGSDVRPTNRLMVSSGNKRSANRPFRPAPSPNHPGPAPSSKSKAAKPPTGSLAPSDLFKVDTRTERVGTHAYGSSSISSSSSSSKSSKSKRVHRESLSQGTSSSSEPQAPPSSTPSLGHKPSTSSLASSSNPTSLSSSVQSTHSHPHKLKKSSTNPSISGTGSGSGRESLETKISLPLRKTGSSDSISFRLLPNLVPVPRSPPREGEPPTSGSIDIGQLHGMELPTYSVAPHPSSRKKKKKVKKSKNRSAEERGMEPMQVESAETSRAMEVKTEPQETGPVSALVGKLENLSSVAISVPGHMITTATSLPGHMITTATSLPGHIIPPATSLPGHMIPPATSLPGHMIPPATSLLGHIIPPATSLPGHMITTATSLPGHMITSEDTSRMSRMPEGSRLSKRPSSIKITSGSGLGVQEESGEVQNMLEEIMRPVPSLITPIPTPKKDKSFAFPTHQPPFSGATKALYSRPLPLATESSQALTTKLKHPGKRPSRLLSSTSSDESDGENKEAVIAAVSTLDSNLAAESIPSPAFHDEAPPTSSGSSSESSSSSDSSSSDSESSSEEEGETISPMLEKLNKQLLRSSSLVTPIKKTPPHIPGMLSTIISPLADDAANLSPPKFASGTFPITTSQDNLAYSQPTSVYSQSSHSASVYSQSSSLPTSVYSHPASVYSQATSAHSQPTSVFTSEGFSHVPAAAPFPSDEGGRPGMDESDSDSSSDSENDSGMESDSESSDSEEQSSEDEEARKSRTLTPPSAASQGAEGLVLFGRSSSSGGFWEDTDFTGRMGATAPLVPSEKSSKTSEASQRGVSSESLAFDTTTQPFDVMATQEQVPVHEQRDRCDSESGSSARRAKKSLESGRSGQRPDPAGNPWQSPRQGAAQQPHERSSRKRKHQQEEVDRESGPESESQPSPPKLPKIRIKLPPLPPVSPLLSPSVFSENESSSSSDEDEDEPEDVAVAPPKPHPPAVLDALAVGTGAMQGEEGEGKRESWRPLQEEGLNRMMVRIPLVFVEVSREPQKPKATVEPYHVTAPTSKAVKRRTSEAAEHEEAPRRRVSHSDYGRHRDDLDRSSDYSHDYRGHEEERGRPHRDGRSWVDPPHERRLPSGADELPPRGGRRHVRGERETGEYRERGSSRETWDRERDYHRERTGEQYWSGYEHYDHREFNERRPRYHADNRGDSAVYFLQEARRRKHDADKIGVPGVEKAKAYMESVVYFMRHGNAVEHNHQAYRMYHDTITIVKCCQNMAGLPKALVALCLRCQSVLYWRMYILKHTTVYQIQKELQDFFILPKSTQKSPYSSSFSPLPSPASVGSTASASSTSSQDPSPSSAAISVPKHIFNKAAEHLNIATFVTQSFELWKHSDALIEQCRDFFLSLRRKAGRITQFSSVPEVADWVEFGLRSSRWT